MNILISYNWLKEYLKTKKSAQELARQFSLTSHTVERLKEIKPSWSKVITAKILEIKPHPNANRLRLAKVTTGEQTYEVVCGAPNIKTGQIVPLALAGAVLLNPQQENQKITVGRAKIRGLESNGMLCSQKELGIGPDHTGIFILPPDTKIGQSLEKVLPINDTILEVEVTANRPDCLSVVGLAWEAAAVLKEKFILNSPKPNLKVETKIPLQVKVTEKKLCPRYQAIVLTDVEIKASPLWLQQRLLAVSIRPINNLVDITNYVMLEYGQPMHVFDYHKLRGGQIIVRRAKAGEKILALDGRWYNLNPSNLVIADAENPVAIAGVMGGEMSAAVPGSKTIVFESANFEPIQVRKTSRTLGLQSESSNLFEKGLSPVNPTRALWRAIELAQEIASAKTASPVFDLAAKKFKPLKIKFDKTLVEKYLGIKIPDTPIKKILTSLGFKVTGQKIWQVQVPWWRTGDINFDYDLIEEVARIFGYHNLPTELPTGEIPVAPLDKKFTWTNQTKNWLVGLGFSELYTYSLISEKLIVDVGFNPAQCLKLANPLSRDWEYLRPTLIGGVLATVAENQKNFPTQKVFELSKVYRPRPNNLPEEKVCLTGAVLGEENLFYLIKGVIEFLIDKWKISGCKIKVTDAQCPLWQKGQAVDVLVGEKFLGQFGIISNKITEKFDIKKPVVLFDFDFDLVCQLAKDYKTLKTIPRFPAISRDLAIIVAPNLIWKSLKELVMNFHPLIKQVEYLSTYQGNELGGKKSIAFRMTFQSEDRTLESAAVDKIIQDLIKSLETKFGAKLRQ